MSRPNPLSQETTLDVSVTAIRHLRLDFNPEKIDEIAQIKMLAGALITKVEKMMHKTIERDELCVDAIRLIRGASMAAVLAATAEVPKEK